MERKPYTAWSDGYDMGHDAATLGVVAHTARPYWSPSFRHAYNMGYRDVRYGFRPIPKLPLLARLRERATAVLMAHLDRLTK